MTKRSDQKVALDTSTLDALLPQRSALRRFVSRAVQPASDVDDIVQEAYLRLMESPPSGRDPAALGGYLFVIARNLITDRSRSLFRDRLRAQGFLCLQEKLDNAATSLDELLIVDRASDCIRRALWELPVRTREVFLLHRVECVSHRDIARRFEVTVRTVERDIAAALRTLRRCLFDAASNVADGPDGTASGNSEES